MKKLIVLLMSFLFFTVVGQKSFAVELSCDELKEISKSIAEVEGYLADGQWDRIADGSKEDKALHEMVGGLKKLSDIEESKDLSEQVKILEKAWYDDDGDAFIDALKKITAIYDEIYKADCK